MTTKQYNVIINAYKQRMMTLMHGLRQMFSNANLDVSGVFDTYGDEYSVYLMVFLPEDQDDIEVRVTICDGHYYDESTDAVTFNLNIVTTEGLIIGGLTPFNYTEKCWVQASNSKAVEERWQYFETEIDHADVLQTVQYSE